MLRVTGKHHGKRNGGHKNQTEILKMKKKEDSLWNIKFTVLETFD